MVDHQIGLAASKAFLEVIDQLAHQDRGGANTVVVKIESGIADIEAPAGGNQGLQEKVTVVAAPGAVS